MKRLTSRTLGAAAVGVAVVGLAAGVSASAAPSRPAPPPPPNAACHVHWFTHPWEPGSFGATINISTARTFPDWLLTFGFSGSERVTQVSAGPVAWWRQTGRSVAIKGDARLRDLPPGDDVLSLPVIVRGTPSGTPRFAVNGRPCTVSSSTAITPTTTTTTTTPIPTTTTTTTTTTSRTSGTSDTCTATYRILYQTATQFRATVSWSENSTVFTSTKLGWVFSGDQQVTELTSDAGANTTWSQNGSTVLVNGFAPYGPHGATFTATYSGQNGPPVSVGNGIGFNCPVTFYPAPTTTTTWAGEGGAH